MIFKLHGSIDWRRRVVGMPFPALAPSWDLLRGAAQWVILHSREGVITDEFDMGSAEGGPPDQACWIPATAVPTENKTESELPGFLLTELQRRLHRVARLHVIGWRGREQHFGELWKRCQPNTQNLVLEVVDKDEFEAASVADCIREQVGCPNVYPSTPTGFSDYISERSELGRAFT